MAKLIFSREKPWRCVGCGHQMNAVGEHVTNVPKVFRPPQEDDVTVCINCSLPYIRHRDRWREMRPEDWLELTTNERAELIKTIASVTESRIKAIIV